MYSGMSESSAYGTICLSQTGKLVKLTELHCHSLVNKGVYWCYALHLLTAWMRSPVGLVFLWQHAISFCRNVRLMQVTRWESIHCPPGCGCCFHFFTISTVTDCVTAALSCDITSNNLSIVVVQMVKLTADWSNVKRLFDISELVALISCI